MRTLLLCLLFAAALNAQIAPVDSIAPVPAAPGTVGLNLSYDLTAKQVIIQSVLTPGAVPVNILSFSPHLLDNGGSFNINVVVSGTTLGIVIGTSGTNLVYRISNGNPAQDKFCSMAVPLPTGAVACKPIPF